MPSLQSLTFDTSELRFDREEGDRKVWFTGDGDGVTLNLFNKKPDLPPAMQSPQQMRDFYMSMLKDSTAKLVELRMINIGGCPAIRLIVKSPQKPQIPSGMTYLGSITVPFRDFSFVVKCQCMERGTAGIREAILLEMAHQAGAIWLDASGKITVKWDTDAAEYDAKFPQHPLSRLRRLLDTMEKTAVLDRAVAKQPPFPLPEQ